MSFLKRQSKGDSPDCPSLSGEAPEIRTAVLKAHCEENFNSELGHKANATHLITRSSLGETPKRTCELTLILFLNVKQLNIT